MSPSSSSKAALVANPTSVPDATSATGKTVPEPAGPPSVTPDQPGVAPDLVRARVEAVRALARASRLLERSSGEVNLAHYRVLAAIASGDERASRIATKLALGKPTVSASVEWLCKRGFLARGGVAGDQRAASLQLTAEGTRWLTAVETGMAAWLDELCARTPAPDQTIQALVWMGEAIEQVAAEQFAEGR